jgi:hypothetical protein
VFKTETYNYWFNIWTMGMQIARAWQSLAVSSKLAGAPLQKDVLTIDQLLTTSTG